MNTAQVLIVGLDRRVPDDGASASAPAFRSDALA